MLRSHGLSDLDMETENITKMMSFSFIKYYKFELDQSEIICIHQTMLYDEMLEYVSEKVYGKALSNRENVGDRYFFVF